MDSHRTIDLTTTLKSSSHRKYLSLKNPSNTLISDSAPNILTSIPQSFKSPSPEPNLKIRRKSIAIPHRFSSNHRSNSGQEYPSKSLICELMSTASHAINNIVEGIKIDRSGEDENASDSIRINREFDSNVIDESEKQNEKHFDPRISTFLGMMID
jgi:hypothetical protein